MIVPTKPPKHDMPILEWREWGTYEFGAFLPYRDSMPPKRWWQFWKRRTREEFLHDLHEEYMRVKTCHRRQGEDFCFCA